MSFASDPSLLQDFLTESSELIEQLDRDLVRLEAAQGQQSTELLNGIFRALHTIKGAASFLALTEVTTFAHAAEDALNRMRKGDVQLTPPIMDVLLRSADIVRGMLGEVSQGVAVTPGPEELVHRLHEITEGKATAAGSPVTIASTPTAAADLPDDDAPAKDGAALSLPPEKIDLLEFMVDDLVTATREINNCLDSVTKIDQRAAAGHRLVELADDLKKTAEFFGLSELVRVTNMMSHAASRFTELSDATLDEVAIRVRGLNRLVHDQAEALRDRLALSWPLDTIAQRLDNLIDGVALDPSVAGQHHGDSHLILELDGVKRSTPMQDKAIESPDPAPSAAAPAASTPGAAPAAGSAPASGNATPMEATIRVEVGRLEALLNMVGQLVLSKNRFLSLSRRFRDTNVNHDLIEELTAASSELDRLTSELQVGVMRTRMQPLTKLFERYPRVIRDIARATGKQIDLQFHGKETEVDKTVLELLADPLIHMLRNSADHGIETPDIRINAGKRPTGTIRLSAEHQGSHVRVELSDDGKGLNREVLGRKAVERGLTTPEAVAAMSDAQVFGFIFAPGFSTAEKVTDLSGRGVGMDVVRTNINKLGGTINLHSEVGKRTTIEILIPLTVAILPALVVGVGDSLYTIPLGSIEEIVRPDQTTLCSVAGTPVMRLRDRVLPLIDLRERLNEPVRAIEPLAVVVGVGELKVGLLVDKLVGRQEVVTKPLDDKHAAGGPFSGATIREDGTVSLILDIIQLVRQGQGQAPARRAA